MAKEVLINCYLVFFKVLFTLFKIFTLRRKIVFVCSYTDNGQFVYDELRRRGTEAEIVFLCRGRTATVHFGRTGETVIPFENANIWQLTRSAYHLATAKLVVVDNYFGFLSVADFKKGVLCIQLWHACGAFKTFGLKDHSVTFRSARARARFSTVYRHFDKIIVGSDAMEAIFRQSFGLGDAHFLHLGIPRTDLFFDLKKQAKIKKSMSKMSSGKKIILYAPTFRDQPLKKLGLDLTMMEEKLSRDYVLILRLHPSDRGKMIDFSWDHEFFIDGSRWDSVNELLLGTDLLVTDYSSIPFEFALLQRPMIFFPYDLNAYKKNRGLWGNYEQMVPGPVAHSTQEVIQMIKHDSFNARQIAAFSEKWNCYSTGQSSSRVVDYFIAYLNKQGDNGHIDYEQ
ncbi:CDP-glycerol glycerophosphotransferase family protein [Sporolactobacillus shoreicorticis]|uniref:CDP-glycerol glycerophosphotransferase family protein n=1 Tax=Sporolactobacillus shoreicorticis TaxID=1923877 RepID=A0ABW5S5U7_9BACL|nr:CDP-glycerol glycerophosphotransferase family protein [Sporolactobacillus shoreicorticis]MCO7126223.1 CDP-glycerol glycerophosphotransferase family protein [Sporolactobacillus shoreicorticis]